MDVITRYSSSLFLILPYFCRTIDKNIPLTKYISDNFYKTVFFLSDRYEELCIFISWTSRYHISWHIWVDLFFRYILMLAIHISMRIFYLMEIQCNTIWMTLIMSVYFMIWCILCICRQQRRRTLGNNRFS